MLPTVILLCAPLAMAATPAENAAKVLEGMELHQTVTLVDAGAEPRQKLRFSPTPGASSTYEVKTSQDLSIGMVGPDGSVMDVPMGNVSPTTTLSMSNHVGQPLDNGMVPVTVRHDGATVEGVSPEMQTIVLAALEPMKGLAFRMLYDPSTGGVAQVDVATTLAPELYQAMQSMADGLVTQMPTFPQEAVGVGASWTIDADLNIAGLALITTQTIEVTKIGDDAVVMSVNLAMRQGEGQMAMPGMPPGAEVSVTSFEGVGAGTMSTNLHTMVSTGKTTMNIDLAMSTSAEGQPPMSMVMGVDQVTEMRAK